MKKIGIILVTFFLLCGCSSANDQNKTDQEEVSTQQAEEIMDTPENRILEAYLKLYDAKSFDVDFFLEATPANEFFYYSKTTLKGTLSDVENMVFEGYYHDEMLGNEETTENTKMDDLITEGPITKKAGEDAILPGEYNGGYDYSLGNLHFEIFPSIYQKPDEHGKSESLEYSITEEAIEHGTRYTIHAVDRNVLDDGTPPYTEEHECIYDVNMDGYLIYAKEVINSPLTTNDGKLTDTNRTVICERTYTNIK